MGGEGVHEHSLNLAVTNSRSRIIVIVIVATLARCSAHRTCAETEEVLVEPGEERFCEWQVAGAEQNRLDGLKRIEKVDGSPVFRIVWENEVSVTRNKEQNL